MIYRFCSPTSHNFLATARTLAAIKAAVRSWYPNSTVRFNLDETGEGWAYANGQRLGYIDVANS